MKHIAWDVLFDILKQIKADPTKPEDKAKMVLEQAERHNAIDALDAFGQAYQPKSE